MRPWAPLLLFLGGCASAPPPVSGVEDLLGAQARVQAFRIGRGPEFTPDYLEWPASAGPIPVPTATARRIADLLLDPASYLKISLPCKPEPGLRLRWSRGDEVADLVFCFQCKTLFSHRNGAYLGSGVFNPSARALARLLKPLFPQDPVVQGLPE